MGQCPYTHTESEVVLLHKLHKLGLLHKLVNARRRGMMVSRIKMMHEVVMEWMCTLLVIV